MRNPGAYPSRWARLAGLLAAAQAALTAPALALDRARFDADLQALCAGPHRLAGRPEGSRRAAAYVEKELRAAGIQEVIVQDFPVVMPRFAECRLEADGQSYPLYAVRPNLLMASVTPAEGLEGETLYAGDGTAGRFPKSLAEGRIAVLDANERLEWLSAFSFGARAELLVFDPRVGLPSLHLNVPADLPRFAVPRELAERLDLTGTPRRVRLHAAASWEPLRGQNVLAVIRGSGSGAKTERRVILLAAPLDSYSEIPELSPGARDAANAAALLGLARDLAARPPAGDVVLAFFDGQSQNHLGARAFYAALCRRVAARKVARQTTEELLQMNQEETAHWRAVGNVFLQKKLFTPEIRRMPEHAAAVRLFRSQVAGHASDTSSELGPLRLKWRTLQAAAGEANASAADREQRRGEAAALAAEMEGIDEEDRSWNAILRLCDRATDVDDAARVRAQAARLAGTSDPAIREARIAALSARVVRSFAVAIEDSLKFCRRRSAELAVKKAELEMDGRIFAALGSEFGPLNLHVSINLGDAGDRWSVIHGDDSLPTLGEDDEGEYSGLFKSVRQSCRENHGRLPHFDPRPVEGLYASRFFVPGRFADSGAVARMFGGWNIAVMTLYDRLARQGLPNDTLEQLNVERFYAQAAELPAFVAALAAQSEVYRPTPRRALAVFPEPRWNGAQLSGIRARNGDIGDPLRSSDVGDALVAAFPFGSEPWLSASPEAAPLGFSWEIRAVTGVSGILELPPLSRLAKWGCFGMFSPPAPASAGRAANAPPDRTVSVSTQASVTGGGGDAGLPPTIYLARTRSVTMVGYGFERKVATMAMQAESTAAFPANRYLLCENGNVLVLFAPVDADGFKLFNSGGIVALNNTATKAGYQGKGFPFASAQPLIPSQVTARDMGNLNGFRLALLRENKIGIESLELLQGRAEDLAAAAGKLESTTAAGYQGMLEASAAYARRTYQPVVDVMKDLVSAVVFILLLTIPFAFSLERLLVGTPHIYRRLGWFAAFFLATFSILFAINPAFKLAATPLIIFLAFTIILLSGMVIFIMLRKLEAELKRMQGMGVSAHSMDVSRMSTMAAAVAMGISTMRRRPLRTVLTASTVILLTFTILTFASFSSEWGIRRAYVGTLSAPPAHVVVRHPVWDEVSPRVFDTLKGFLEERAEVVARYWVSPRITEVRAAVDNKRNMDVLVVNAESGAIVPVSAAIGLASEDLRQQERLRACFAPSARPELLETNGLFLTPPVAGALGMTEADVGRQSLTFLGRPMVFGGLLTDQFRTASLIDGSSLLPVDYKTSLGGTADSLATASQDRPTPVTDTATFLPFAADRVVLMGATAARDMGGRLRAITAYPRQEQETAELARDLAVITGLPCYAGSEGEVSRLVFAPLFSATGLKALVIPIVLGGLIIFATMLGSVADREREIYAFSALGLAPPHVSMLFFAEASVYAVVGGMGGYLLGQAVAAGLSFFAARGWFSVPSMNFSSMNAVMTIFLVMGIVMLSTLYPAMKASRSANPGIQRSWQLPPPREDVFDIHFPFTVSEYDLIGVMSYLEEHFRNFSDTSIGVFTSLSCRVFREAQSEKLGFEARVALAPFDLGIEQSFTILSRPSEVEGIDEIRVLIRRCSGAYGDWQRANKVFIRDIRKQFLLWRTLDDSVARKYRERTLQQWDQLAERRRAQVLEELGAAE